jgi:carbonic anhydrase
MTARRRGRGVTLALAAAATLALGCGADDGDETEPAASAAEWSYEGETGPEHWGSLSPAYAACGEGSRQSPIDLHRGEAGERTDGSVEYEPVGSAVVDTGHSIEYELEGGGSVELDGRSYELAQAHYHAPAEHPVDGVRRPMEIHLVHRARGGELAVIGVTVEEGEEHAALQPYADAIAAAGTEPEPVGELDPAALLPGGGEGALTAFSYLGSLTTPPCAEDVRWLGADEPLTVSDEQLDAFTEAYEGNARPAQQLNGREPLRAALRAKP